MQYAGYWRRFTAFVIDATLFSVVQTVISVAVIGGVMTTMPGEEAAVVAVIAINLAMFTVMWLYFALMESSSLQGTLVKMMVGVVVTDVNGDRISFGRASGRYFAKGVSAVILMIGYVMAAFTERKQALHDIIAGCLVIRKPKTV